ncbi:hypothetical protein NX059_010143 [Plenodomus lindquistii]|nr:hypothetical protein NX059_010143 [Plenodomus lindquistii]
MKKDRWNEDGAAEMSIYKKEMPAESEDNRPHRLVFDAYPRLPNEFVTVFKRIVGYSAPKE